MITLLLLMIGQGIITALVILGISTVHNNIRSRSFAKLFNNYLKERAETDVKVKASDLH